ncbi:MAG: Serine--tRNA ligase [Calditrichaeota bacterium]|nr:Serine--tRNA ligase [Calditrichota bacterium]
MHDIRRLRRDPDEVRRAILRKGFEADVGHALALDARWRELTARGDELKAELNTASKAIGQAKKAGRDAEAEMARARALREQASALDDEKRQVKSELDELLLSWPAEPDPRAPDGLSEEQNVVLRESELPVTPDFELHDHLALAEALGILDMPRGAKITGGGWPVYRGEGARLERALVNFMLDIQTADHGYTELFVPFAVNRESALGTAQLPKLDDDMYLVEKDDLYLIPTSEVPITNLHRGEILDGGALPLKYTAYSACFRREAGAYGAETRGLLRVHQFNKVELVQIVRPEQSERVQEEILAHATAILDRLKLGYRIVDLCCGELSFGAARCLDVEVWAPGTKAWLETSSVSNFREFQARRMMLRARIGDGGRPELVHTLNGSGLATSRLMVALLETYQTPEGRVRVPAALQPYLGGLDMITGA